ncbi:MAG: rRNA maturation RNase YbeY [Fidelibacterota bacterium]|nr:MAG: rRNA maturation RNase YbeY [Candidatus Neomarinimicrobiota bacterium]
MITVDVDTLSGEPLPLSPQVVIPLARATLTEHGAETGHLQIVFTSDEHMRALKQQFFELDEYTDVIAFTLNEVDEALDGEIYISPERARANSKRFHEPYQRELMRLVVHGCLHLVGYDDDTPANQAGMRTLENHHLAPFSETLGS